MVELTAVSKAESKVAPRVELMELMKAVKKVKTKVAHLVVSMAASWVE